MKTKYDYYIAEANSTEKLQNIVDVYINSGWKICGGIAVTRWEHQESFYQALIKFNVNKKSTPMEHKERAEYIADQISDPVKRKIMFARMWFPLDRFQSHTEETEEQWADRKIAQLEREASQGKTIVRPDQEEEYKNAMSKKS